MLHPEEVWIGRFKSPGSSKYRVVLVSLVMSCIGEDILSVINLGVDVTHKFWGSIYRIIVSACERVVVYWLLQEFLELDWNKVRLGRYESLDFAGCQVGREWKVLRYHIQWLHNLVSIGWVCYTTAARFFCQHPSFGGVHFFSTDSFLLYWSLRLSICGFQLSLRSNINPRRRWESTLSIGKLANWRCGIIEVFLKVKVMHLVSSGKKKKKKKKKQAFGLEPILESCYGEL